MLRKRKKLILISCAALALVVCVSAIVFVAEISKDDLPDCTYKITDEQREMSTYDLLKWFGETEYIQNSSKQYDDDCVKARLTSPLVEPSLDPDNYPCNDHQAYYELLQREDLYDAFWELTRSNEYPNSLTIFSIQSELNDILHTMPRYGE